MPNNVEAEGGRVSGPGLTAAVRSFPLIVVALALVGAVVGAGLTMVRPAAYSASARVVLGAESDVNVYRNVPSLTPPARAQAASAALSSLRVREAASKALEGRLSAKTIEKSVTVVPADNAAIVTVTAERDSAASAAEVANAMANAYVSVTNSVARERGDRAQAAVLKQITTARTELTAVQAQRAKRSATLSKGLASVEPLSERARLIQGALRTDALYSGLTNRADEMSDSITALRETLDQNKIDDALTVNGVDTVYAATVPTSSVTGSLVRNSLAGLVLGLVLGVVVAWLMLERRGAREADAQERSDDDFGGTGLSADDQGIAAPAKRRRQTASAAAR